MTIEEMRSAMRSIVVPEEVVPQNVINSLIDEDAEPPKLDAFAFLMRLRALGIGSTDFVNLLEGCGAPESAVARIKQNPAMNLQNLILTLESSELNSDDYMRMLLTARQVWERTLTLRLEKAEALSHEIEEYEEEYEEEPETVSEETAELETPEEEEPDAPEEPIDNDDEDDYLEEALGEEYEEEFDPEYDEDMREMSFTAVFEKINAEIREGRLTPETLASEASAPEEPLLTPDTTDTPETPEPSESNEEPAPAAVSDMTEDLSFTAAFDQIKSRKKTFSDESPSVIPIEIPDNEIGERIEKTEGENIPKDEPPHKLEEEPEEEPEDNSEEEFDEEPEEEVEERIEKRSLFKTARQKKQPIIEEEFEDEPEDEADDFDDEYDEEDYDDEYDDEDYDEDDDRGERKSFIYNKPAIIGAAAGAVILICAGVIIGTTVGKSGSKSLRYAKNTSEIFDKIYYAYDAKTPGGDDPSAVSPDYSTLFGDLLISGEGSRNNIGSFSIGTELYSVTEGAISANVVENGTIRPLADVVPPDNARFVAAFDDDGKLYALFSGKQSGYVKVSGGKAEYMVRQDGVLTDYEYSDGEIKLGTVYTPAFTESFTQEDEDVYLPRSGKDEPSAISAKDVIISETAGYSYGVSAGYSADNGERKEICAVIGDPVAASADGRFALNNGENGMIMRADGKTLTTTSTDKLVRVAFCENGGAMIEDKTAADSSESGSDNAGGSGSNIATLFGSDLKPASILAGVPEKITGMWFDDNLLTINGEADSILRVDCASLSKPNPLTLKTVAGITAERSALTLETNGNTIVITRYDLENGTAKKLAEYSKTIEAEQISDVKLGSPAAAVISGETSGVAYSYFDGVSVVSEYVVFANGQQPKTETLFDDSTGFTAAFLNGDKISAVCGEGVKVPQ